MIFYIMESLILAQNERWRRVLSMQVEREWSSALGMFFYESISSAELQDSGARVSNA
jgi:hypothetical protein